MAEEPAVKESANWKRHPWRNLPTWGKWTVGIVGVLFVMGIGAAIGAGENDEGALKDELAAAERKTATAEDRQLEAEEEAEAVIERKRQIIAQAKGKAAKIEGELTSEESQLEETEGQLSSAQEDLSGVQEEKRLSTIPGNGTFQAEVDYVPGTYKSEGGPSCYWATLNSPDNFDIVNNENASGPTIADVTTPYFQTDGCGEWERVGE